MPERISTFWRSLRKLRLLSEIIFYILRENRGDKELHGFRQPRAVSGNRSKGLCGCLVIESSKHVTLLCGHYGKRLKQLSSLCTEESRHEYICMHAILARILDS